MLFLSIADYVNDVLQVNATAAGISAILLNTTKLAFVGRWGTVSAGHRVKVEHMARYRVLKNQSDSC